MTDLVVEGIIQESSPKPVNLDNELMGDKSNLQQMEEEDFQGRGEPSAEAQFCLVGQNDLLAEIDVEEDFQGRGDAAVVRSPQGLLSSSRESPVGFAERPLGDVGDVCNKEIDEEDCGMHQSSNIPELTNEVLQELHLSCSRVLNTESQETHLPFDREGWSSEDIEENTDSTALEWDEVLGISQPDRPSQSYLQDILGMGLTHKRSESGNLSSWDADLQVAPHKSKRRNSWSEEMEREEDRMEKLKDSKENKKRGRQKNSKPIEGRNRNTRSSSRAAKELIEDI